MSELRKDPIIDRWVYRRHRAQAVARPIFPPSIEPTMGRVFRRFAHGQEDKNAARSPRKSDGPEDQPKDSPGWRVRVVPKQISRAGQFRRPRIFRGHGMYDLMKRHRRARK